MRPSAAVSITPNWSAWSSGARSAATVTAAPLVDVLVDHLARVHAVDVVGAEHDHVVGPLVVEQVEVLVDRVGRAGEPARAAAHLRGHRRDVVAEQRRQPPGGRDVAVERVALVLREHDDPAVARVDEVRQREVDQPVVAAERHGGLGAVGVSGARRLPSPPASTIAKTSGISSPSQRPAPRAPGPRRGSARGAPRPRGSRRRPCRRPPYPTGRAANQPLSATTLSPPIGAPLPGASVSTSRIGSPASSRARRPARARAARARAFCSGVGGDVDAAVGRARRSARPARRRARPGRRPVVAFISAASRHGIRPSLSVVHGVAVAAQEGGARALLAAEAERAVEQAVDEPLEADRDLDAGAGRGRPRRGR